MGEVTSTFWRKAIDSRFPMLDGKLYSGRPKRTRP